MHWPIRRTKSNKSFGSGSFFHGKVRKTWCERNVAVDFSQRWIFESYCIHAAVIAAVCCRTSTPEQRHSRDRLNVAFVSHVAQEEEVKEKDWAEAVNYCVWGSVFLEGGVLTHDLDRHIDIAERNLEKEEGTRCRPDSNLHYPLEHQ